MPWTNVPVDEGRKGFVRRHSTATAVDNGEDQRECVFCVHSGADGVVYARADLALLQCDQVSLSFN